MKYCLISNLYPPHSRGGAEKIVFIIAQKLAEQNEVLIISSQPAGDSSTEHKGNLKIVRLNPRNIYYLLNGANKNILQKLVWHCFDFFNFKVLKKVKKELVDFKPDVVFTHNLKGLSLSIPKVIKSLGLHHVHTLHDYQLLDPHGTMYRKGQNLGLGNVFYRIYRLMAKMAFGTPNTVISPSQFVLDKHLAYGFFKNSKSAVLPNPIEFIAGQQIKKTASAKLRLLYLGQIEPHKGVEFLIKTFLSWPQADAELTIAGEGSDLEKIKEISLTDSRLKILGKIKGQELENVFNNTDVLIVPSLWQENSPTVIYEAYARKIPVLVSDSGGSKELIKESVTGFVFKSNNQADLLEKLNYLWQNKNNLPALGENGYHFVQDFNLDKYIGKLFEK